MLIYLFVFLIIFLGAEFLRYYFAPPEYQQGIKIGRSYTSRDNLIFYTLTGTIIFLFMSTYSKIVQKIIIHEDKKHLTIELIERFRIKPRTYTVLLSEVKITKEINPSADDKYNYNAKYVRHALILSSEKFGDIYINDNDFIQINMIIEEFENLRLNVSKELRKRRLLKRRNN